MEALLKYQILKLVVSLQGFWIPRGLWREVLTFCNLTSFILGVKTFFEKRSLSFMRLPNGFIAQKSPAPQLSAPPPLFRSCLCPLLPPSHTRFIPNLTTRSASSAPQTPTMTSPLCPSQHQACGPDHPASSFVNYFCSFESPLLSMILWSPGLFLFFQSLIGEQGR